MAKYEIIINEIAEDGSKHQFYPNPEDDDPVVVEGFCLMAKYDEEKKGFRSNILIHDVSAMHLAMMIDTNPHLREAASLRKVLHAIKEAEADAAE